MLVHTSWAADEPDCSQSAKAYQVFKTHCVRCHSGPNSEGGDFNILLRKDLIEGEGLVVPKDLTKSQVYARMVGNSMPPRQIPQRPTEEEIAMVKEWIEQDAPEFPIVKARKFIELTTVYQAIRDYLIEQNADDRPFLRFITLQQLHNNSKFTDQDLAIYKAALSKAVNSVSRGSEIVLPYPIDQSELFADRKGFLQGNVFVIDIRDYRWHENDVWSDLMRIYPYALSYASLPAEKARLEKLSEDVGQLTGDCTIPVIRADWFISNATRPPLYHHFLQIPDTLAELEREHGVDREVSFMEPKPEHVAYAGFSKSGVSAQNRHLERHSMNNAPGYMWISNDFAPDSGAANLTRFPLGPLNIFPDGRHPYTDNAFSQDGGEIIWTLPNGLQAYMLIDGQGHRINEGPIRVVNDPLETSGTPEIVNGVSCMACHKNGMIKFTDAIREGNAVFGDAEDKVKKLYPPQKTMDGLLQKDIDLYMASLKKVFKPYEEQLSRDFPCDNPKPIEDWIEPVGHVSRYHQNVYLDLQTIACELDIQNPDDVVKTIGAKNLKKLGLEQLLKPNGVISRAQWEAFRGKFRKGPSLMQELAREMRFIPVRPF